MKGVEDLVPSSNRSLSRSQSQLIVVDRSLSLSEPQLMSFRSLGISLVGMAVGYSAAKLVDFLRKARHSILQARQGAHIQANEENRQGHHAMHR
jgi:hypothetical protein